MFGDGSDGPLNVLSGAHKLALNTKHQFTTVNIAAGAVLTTDDTQGAVLYITARESITIDGVIDLSNKVTQGNNSWSVIIDGVSYASPGVAPGLIFGGTSQTNSGHGGGGPGGSVIYQGTQYDGGISSNTGYTPAPGAGGYRYSGTNEAGGANGTPGQQSGGGGGAAASSYTRTSGDRSGSAQAQGGVGGASFGANGQDGTGSFGPSSGTGNATRGWVAHGGGGAGGQAGRAGVHLVLKAPRVIINGQVITKGTDGGNGGNGGRYYSHNGASEYWAEGGLGGGGGFGGDVRVTYASEYTHTGSQDRSGGLGGAAGFGGYQFQQRSDRGNKGATGFAFSTQITSPDQYPTLLTAASIPSAEAFGGHAFIPDALGITASSVPSAQALSIDHVITFFITATSAFTSETFSANSAVVLSPPPPPPPTDWEAIGKEDDKVYVYRVYTSSGEFIGIWTDVGDDLQFTQSLNTALTTATVKLNRSPDTTKEVRASFITQAGDTIQTQDGYDFSVTYETNNSVGAGTDVEINLNVDVYVHYGEFANLTTQDLDFIVTEDGDQIVVASGYPMGKRVFSGYILDYELLYGNQSGVWVTLISHGAELSQGLIRSGETIVVNYPSQELATTAKSILDTNPAKMTYAIDSIQNTGVSAAFKFQLNTKLDGIESVFGQTPEGWCWYGDVAENQVVIKPRATVADHTFKLGYHVKTVKLKRSAEQLRNLVYFVGAADSNGVSILKKYQDATSQATWRTGLQVITDRRYSVANNMQRRAEKEMAYREPVYTTEVTISSARYDIETIKLGQMVAFTDTEGPLREVLLQIVRFSYARTEVTLQLGALLDSQADIIEGVSETIANEQYSTLPNAPS